MRRLVIEQTIAGISAALLDEDALHAFWMVDDDGLDLATDCFFQARVEAVDSRLGAFFLDIGGERPAFLTGKDVKRSRQDDSAPLNRLLKVGERLVVQGIREADGDKGPRVTTDLKLMGFHLIYRPNADPDERLRPVRGAGRQLLQDRGMALFPNDNVTLRKLAAEAADDTLLSEFQLLKTQFAAIEKATGQGRTGVLYRPSALERVVQNALDSGPLDVIEVADAALLVKTRRLLADRLAELDIELLQLQGEAGAFEQTGVEDEISHALGREVALHGGGRLFIEQTAAFVAIDVDAGGSNALDVNLEAAAEIARLVKLRNLGGSIVIDFVDLPTKPQRLKLETDLKKAFRDDIVPVDIYPMSPLGIVQISRARRGRSLDALLTRQCPLCDGTGAIESTRVRAEILRRELDRMPGARAKVGPEMAHFLKHLGGSFPYRYVMDPSLPDDEWTIDQAG